MTAGGAVVAAVVDVTSGGALDTAIAVDAAAVLTLVDVARVEDATLTELWTWVLEATLVCAVEVVDPPMGSVAATEAALPVSCVAVFGTAVHRMLLMLVMENPAGRFAFVDIMK
jgi:hypothetical protein